MTDVLSAASDALLDVARTGRDALIANAVARGPLSEIDRVDADRYFAALVEGALQFVFTDPSRPAFIPWTTPDRRWVDNGRDARYWMAPVDGRHRYRVHGTRGTECYLAFTLYAGDPGTPERAALNVNHLDLDAAPGDPYSIELEPPDDGCYVITRQYFLDADHDQEATMAIEVIDGPPVTTPDEARLADRWAAATSFLRAMTAPRAAGGAAPPAYVSIVPNTMGDPAAWNADETAGRGTPDQTYAMGPYVLEPDEALVMGVRFPACTYASAALWNRFSQTADVRPRHATINAREAVAGGDGCTRIVVAHRDPGVPNWLDTGGRRQGSIFWRFLLAREPVGPIRCEVTPVDRIA